MAIEDKIREIQGKSESVRIAYIIFFVTIIMTFVVVLWIFSIRVDVQAVVNDVGNTTVVPGGGNQLQEIRDAINESGNVLGGVIDGVEKISDAVQVDDGQGDIQVDVQGDLQEQ